MAGSTRSARDDPSAEVLREHPERFDPASDRRTLTASEHYARYLWASQVAAGKRVLDAGSGTGYGSALLAAAGAAHVVGVDASTEAVATAEREHEAVEFRVADVHELPFDDGQFDLVVCFEVIEHVERGSAALAELKRVLQPSGLLLTSSPNRAAYPPGNPHHVFEYMPAELVSEVGALFRNVALYRQDARLGSAITSDRDGSRDGSLEPRTASLYVTEDAPGEMSFALVAASDEQLASLGDCCVLGEPFEVRWWHERHAEALSSAAEARRTTEELRSQLEEARAHARAAGEALITLEATRARELESLRQSEMIVEDAQRELQALAEAHREAHLTIQAMQRTRVWRIGTAYWRLRDALLRRRR